jgi:hypothetical protein
VSQQSAEASGGSKSAQSLRKSSSAAAATHHRPSKKNPPKAATRTTKVLVFELIGAETRVPKGDCGSFFAGDIAGRWWAQDFSTLSPSMAGRSSEKRALGPVQRLASEIQGTPAETERILAEIQSYDPRCYMRKASMFGRSFIGPGDRRSKQTASQPLACSAANQRSLLLKNEAIV